MDERHIGYMMGGMLLLAVDTLYKLAKALDVPMESLVEDAMDYRSDFEAFKSNICHMVKDMGDMDLLGRF